MSEPKFTKGPWRLTDSNDDTWIRVIANRVDQHDPHGEFIADCCNESPECVDEDKANAHLIAAAPELFEALVRIRETDEAALKELEGMELGHVDLCDEVKELWDLADKAIAKALGKEAE